MLPSLRALVFPMAQCSTSSAQNCKRLRSYIQHNCALPDADDLALRAQKFKIADSRCRTSASRAQKPRFCARKAQKRGSRRPKAHKNLDFVLEMPENGGPEGRKRTKTLILCSKCLKTRAPKAKKAQKHRFCARGERNWHREAQPLPSCKSPRTLQKHKCLITKQLTFSNALGELKLSPPRGPICPGGA